MTPLNFRASEPHFVDHLAPIWHALQPAERGVFAVPKILRPHLEQHGIPPVNEVVKDQPTLVASFGDLKRARTLGPVIYMEHGAGQTYVDTEGRPISGSYIGGDRTGVIAVLVPGPYALRHHQQWSDLPAYPIGCPKMDRWHGRPLSVMSPVVGVTWHWNCQLTRETETAFMHYRSGLKDALRGRDVLGHSHPRGDRRMAKACEHHGWRYTEHLTDLFHIAGVLVADNTSALYEFASLGRPVIVCNGPQYRRDIHHGLRFWSHIPGRMVDDAHQLGRALRTELPLCDPAILADVYATTDGTASARAATAIREVLT